jgi:hypothetical protein
LAEDWIEKKNVFAADENHKIPPPNLGVQHPNELYHTVGGDTTTDLSRDERRFI